MRQTRKRPGAFVLRTSGTSDCHRRTERLPGNCRRDPRIRQWNGGHPPMGFPRGRDGKPCRTIPALPEGIRNDPSEAKR